MKENIPPKERKEPKFHKEILFHLRPFEDVFAELIPFLSLQEALAVALTNQKQWIFNPTFVSIDGVEKLNSFWHLLIRYQWRNVIANNIIVRLAKLFKWNDSQLHLFYGELYQRFYEAHPDGPGQSAVDVKSPLVPPVPLLMVPQLEEKQSPPHELLFVYSCLAYYMNNYNGESINLSGKAISEKEFREHHATKSWFARLPSSQMYHLDLPVEEGVEFYDHYRIVTSAYEKVHIPGITTQDRFTFARFLFHFISVCNFTITLYGNTQRQTSRGIPFDIDNFYKEVADDAKKTSKYRFVLNHSGSLWWMTIRCSK
jgi:hypothetical protein